jgi:AcrR family transcriptional regulator
MNDMTTKRSYRLGRRGEAAEETRRRIVESTFALHNEQGVAATSMKQIADRAGVSIGTVYHHFPSYEDAIRACSHHATATGQPPDPSVLAGIASGAERIQRLTAEVFGFYARLPGYARVRADQDQFPMIRQFVRREEGNRLAMVRIALGTPAPREDRVHAVAAMLDIAVFQTLIRAGLSTERAAAEMADIIVAGLVPAFA